MPKHLNRPSMADPPYPWKDYIVGLESKIDRLQTELDNMRAKAQQPSLFGGPAEEAPAPVAAAPLPDYEQNRLGGFTADSETSRQAALDNYPRSGRQRHEILMAVFRSGAHGMTFDEVREQNGIYSADRRMSELVDGGWLDRTERTRKTTHGSDANVMVCSQKAIDTIRVREPQVFAEATTR